jgi:hypothetical protein
MSSIHMPSWLFQCSPLLLAAPNWCIHQLHAPILRSIFQSLPLSFSSTLPLCSSGSKFSPFLVSSSLYQMLDLLCYFFMCLTLDRPNHYPLCRSAAHNVIWHSIGTVLNFLSIELVVLNFLSIEFFSYCLRKSGTPLDNCHVISSIQFYHMVLSLNYILTCCSYMDNGQNSYNSARGRGLPRGQIKVTKFVQFLHIQSKIKFPLTIFLEHCLSVRHCKCKTPI